MKAWPKFLEYGAKNGFYQRLAISKRSMPRAHISDFSVYSV